MSKYKRTEIVDAIQWTGENQDEVVQFLGEITAIHCHWYWNPVFTICTNLGVWLPKIGDFIVCDANCDVICYDPITFEWFYERA